MLLFPSWDLLLQIYHAQKENKIVTSVFTSLQWLKCFHMQSKLSIHYPDLCDICRCVTWKQNLEKYYPVLSFPKSNIMHFTIFFYELSVYQLMGLAPWIRLSSKFCLLTSILFTLCNQIFFVWPSAIFWCAPFLPLCSCQKESSA